MIYQADTNYKFVGLLLLVFCAGVLNADVPATVHLGNINPFSFSGLFLQPESRGTEQMRSDETEWKFTVNASQTTADMEDKGYYLSKADMTMLSADIAYRYGYNDMLELSVRGGVGMMAGSFFLDDSFEAEYYDENENFLGLDDITLDARIFLLEGDGDMERWMTFLQNPLNSRFDSVSQSWVVSLKLPVGSTDHYLSSGSFDFGIGVNSSYKYDDSKSLDAGLHYTIVGDVDESLFGAAADAKSFLTIDYTYRQSADTMDWLAGLAYNTKQMSSPYDYLENSGLLLRGGVQIKAMKFDPTFGLAIKDLETFNLNFSITY